MRRIRDMVFGGLLVLTLVGVGFFGRGLVEEPASAGGTWQFLVSGPAREDTYTEAIEAVPAGCDLFVITSYYSTYYVPLVYYRCP
jgi:hypothetical protein